MASALADIAHYQMTERATAFDVIFYLQKAVLLKIVYNKKKIQIFGMNMPFISSGEAQKRIFYLWLCHS